MKKGFTLIELLVVILVIGILATLAIVNLTSAREKSRDTKRHADMKSLGTVLEAYYNDESTYPPTGPNQLVSELESDLAPKFLVTVPKDPMNSGIYVYKYVLGTADMSYGLGVTYESTGVMCVTGVNINDATVQGALGTNKCAD